jgi:hypothetical protein
MLTTTCFQRLKFGSQHAEQWGEHGFSFDLSLTAAALEVTGLPTNSIQSDNY